MREIPGSGSNLANTGGLVVRRPTQFDGERPYLATADVQGRRARPSEVFAFENIPARAGLVLAPGDVLQAKMAETDKALVVSGDMAGWLASTGFAQFAPDPNVTDPFFLYHWLRSAEFLRVKDSLCVGSTQRAISSSDLSRICVCFPPVNEQRRISQTLSIVDDVVEQTEALLAKIQQIKSGFMHDVFTRGIAANGELRAPPDEAPKLYKESPIGLVPREWQPQKLGQLSPRLAGRLIVQPHQYFSEEGVPIVFGANIQEGKILLHGLKRISFEADARFARHRVRHGDLLTIRVGVPGMTAVVPQELDGCHFASTMLIRRCEAANSLWLSYCMNSSVIRRQIANANYGSVQTQFNVSDAREFHLALPSLVEQERAVERLLQLDDVLETNRAYANKVEWLRAGLRAELLGSSVSVMSKHRTAGPYV